ncbi:tyrosine-protein kinase JAK2-like [Limulus polyphemus]|uniref:Tyrosine-protein kinase n=1 Tax=Limulus polyphemus TaxID=6850 RepID=A0ABM1SJ66_LIMPO|nr:tyrosine-protein kinase JAK2-like [Limulus polyphemus]XP_022243670.1 tyrosine-protein kinase JAK2-like [Limulus polyphemus]XP_022243671.1 tyrosine-protein kinase JAK2-like [Limulus polyphemus]
MEGGVEIYLYTYTTPLLLPGDKIYIAEDLCIYAAKACHIGPVGRHLFSLWCPQEAVWLSLSKRIDSSKGKKWKLHFRIRFKPPSIKQLKTFTDENTFNYYFHQMRSDFLSGKIPEVLKKNFFEKALGLAVTDMVRDLLVQKLQPQDKKINYCEFLPQDLRKNKFWISRPVHKALLQCWQNSKQNVDFVKEEYMQQLYELVPNYGYEVFKAQVDEEGKVWMVNLQVDPYCSEQPGLSMYIDGSKNTKRHICTIEDLCFISMRNDGTVEINRRNGIPQHFRFNGVDVMHSFISLLDGYYRLIEKWTFNLCKELATPSLLSLKSMKAHGPVGSLFAYQKLKEKRNCEVGSFILRQSTSCYGEFRLDVCCSQNVNETEGRPETFQIKIYDENYYINNLSDVKESFPTIPQLIAHYSQNNSNLQLKYCIPPSEYDKTHLLLCRPECSSNPNMTIRGECNCSAQCIPHDALILSLHKEYEHPGQYTVVYHARLRRSEGEYREVAVKTLKKHCMRDYMQEFLVQCDKTLFWQSEAIVSTVGVSLAHPLSLVMEYLPLGPLDKYLQSSKSTLKQVDLVEATIHVAKALWYLEEHKCIHGKIRCRNVLVVSHTENSFRVKLADPGIYSYSLSDIHWIPPEYYAKFTLVSKSSAADVWAFGTTVWEIFSYGQKPLDGTNPSEAKDLYQKGVHLPCPLGCHADIYKLMLECWSRDPDIRKQPQAIVRDIYQTLYEVYNSRRNHSYATVDPQPTLSQPPEEVFPPSLPDPPPSLVQQGKGNGKKNWKGAFGIVTNNSYNQLSLYSGSSEKSTATCLSHVENTSGGPTNSVDSLIHIDNSHEMPADECPTPSIDTSPNSLWRIEEDNLKMDQTLGKGFYGEVCKALLTQCEGLRKELVAVKRIKRSNLTDCALKDFCRETEIMKNLQHKNIVEIKGVVEEPEMMLVMEFVEKGSLLAYLNMYKDHLTHQQLLKFASDVAEGMEYLEQKKIVHRDLAARNILVASKDLVKISDFGLAQFTEGYYYWMKTERNLPIRWYSPESINLGKFSHKSDVWSFGVTLWEMFSFGENPQIDGVKDNELAEALNQGKRLCCPKNCPVYVYQLMLSCWQGESQERPNFSNIRNQIEDLKEQL